MEIRWDSLSGDVELLEPGLIGEFHVDQDENILLGREKAKFLDCSVIGETKIDLNEGYEKHQAWDTARDEKLKILCRWIMKQAPKGENLSAALSDIDFVARRGLLRRIAVTPYTFTYCEWGFVAMRKNGAVFLCSKEKKNHPVVLPHSGGCFDITGFKKAGNVSKSGELVDFDLQTYRGHKLEQILMKPRLKLQVAQDKVAAVDLKEEFRVVHNLILDGVQKKRFRILCNSEVDGFDADDNCIEVKLLSQSEDGKIGFVKNINSWVQCQLAGVDKIVAGIVISETGTLIEVKKMSLQEWKDHSRGTFRPGRCWNFLHSVLDSVDEFLEENSVCEVDFKRGDRCATLRPYDPILSSEFKDHFNLF